ncbi:MAG TPA: proton-conducting transporter membrane subunit, partial [Draconibacterium sp.]|nr:proton-conducting transporter membrane subunit [Draconibacterium sp.]
MSIEQFYIMRHELVLTLAIIILLIAEIATSEQNKKKLIPFSIWLFGLVTLVGFIPSQAGGLFGGSYQSSALTALMKNILNIGVFIIFLQAEGWLKRDENADRISEYFLLTLATLIGMNFMISAGDFLIFYIGIETATIPIAGLAAFDKIRSRSAEAGIKLILSSALSSGVLL